MFRKSLPAKFLLTAASLLGWFPGFVPLFAIIGAVNLCLASLCVAETPPAFESVSAYLDQSVDDGVVAGGSLMVFHQGEIVYQTGFGYADIETKRPYLVDTPAVVASVSKPILGTLLHRLADQKIVELDAPIDRYIEEFKDCQLETGEPIKRAPTLTELLTHTSGLRNDEAPGGRVWYQPWATNQPLEFVVRRIATEFPFKRQPGTKLSYSGIGTEVAARVGEIVTDQPRNEMLLTHLCEPLGMTQTFYRDVVAVEKLKAPMPTRYYIGSKSGTLLVSRERLVPDKNRYSSSGGTIISTASDLLTWLLMIRNDGMHDGEEYLSDAICRRLLTEHEVGFAAKGGLFVRQRDESGKPTLFSHTGSSGTNVWFDVPSDTIGIMLTQTRGSDIRPFRIELQKRVTEAVAELNLVAAP
ncbi:serine hydrolase domain-containing protein [Roseiconus lacunae]|uniref:serine hydrolase domain-containing protein n=1 Tax=Roseiconus lacunae TaxID=2605694 RepID=UPI0011F323A2|nr:serine hydrolase domain-containing protein [Roseiconus lacunae]